MNDFLLNLLAIFCYFYAAIWQGLHISQKIHASRYNVLAVGLLAVVLHGFLLHHWIDVGSGQNLTLFIMFSLVAWLVALLIILGALRMPVENLVIFIFPLAGFSMILVMAFPSQHILETGANPKNLIHILLSVLAMSLFCVAAVQAIVLAIQDRRLRKAPMRLWQVLPPLQTMEVLLFQMIGLGFLVLSVVIVTALAFFHAVFAPPLLQKTLLSLLAWIVYAILLVGRYYFGWRGTQAIRWTLSGFSLLVLAYLSSRWLLN